MAIDPQQQHNLHFVDPFLFYEVEWSVKDNTRRVPEIYLTARQTNLIQQGIAARQLSHGGNRGLSWHYEIWEVWDFVLAE